MRRHAGCVLAMVLMLLGGMAGRVFAQTAPQRVPGPLTVASPNGALVVTLGTDGQLTWSVALRGGQILRPSRIAMTLDGGRILGEKPVVSGTSTQSADRILKPVVRIKRAEIRDRYNERRIDFAGGNAILVRAYDDGVAYRWVTTLPGEITVMNEDVTLAFTDDHLVYFPEETSLLSHQERQYKRLKLTEISPGRFSSLPAMVEMPGGVKVVISEADLFDYPGMDLTCGAEAHSLKGLFPAYPKKVELGRDRNERVVEREDYIARTRGTREYPWRVLAIAERDEDLLNTDIVYRLASETTMTDTSWIKPGKVAWDWWNDLNVYGVLFKSGVNTDTYKHYIDFAAENGIDYIILDEGWYKLGDLLAISPGVDMEAIAAHAKQKNVGLIMWVIWKTLDLQMGPALDQFEKWGVKGIKVDFMQREDQWMVNYYERVAREAAKRKMLVDFHGAYKPTGLYRTWPHVITSEGVLGLEQSKWGDLASPDNAVTFPFMRMLAGPVDYTPGAMLNAAKKDFQPIYNRPMSQGTRCQQLAMYVVFESPLQMLADSPSNYRREPESLAFLSAVPTVWDDTQVLSAKVGEHILVARRRGREWYVGALTNWDARDLDVNLSFLGSGTFQAEIFRDGANAHRAGVDYAREKQPVTASDRLPIHLAPGGGWVARITARSGPKGKARLRLDASPFGAEIIQCAPGRCPMSIPASIERFVTSNGVPFTPIHHRVAFTAQEEAAAAHVPGREWAKTVVCLADGKPLLALLPAHYQVNVAALKALTQATDVRLATEHELAGLYPDCDTGAMAPFGSLYGQPVYMDESLADDPEIVFHAGTHADAMRMRLTDFIKLVQPVRGHFAVPIHRGH